MSKIKQRADGRYRVAVYIGYKDGKSQYKHVYGKTQAEAEKKAKEIRKRLLLGERIEASDRPLKDWVQMYLDTTEEKVSRVYFSGIRGRLKWWMEQLGEKTKVRDIRVSDIQIALDSLAKRSEHTGKPLSKHTLSCYRADLHAALQMALRDRAITFNPADSDYVDIAKNAPKKERFALNDTERQWIEDTPHRAQLAALIMMYTGLRLGELLALTVADIDTNAAVLSVNKAVYYGEDGNTPFLKKGGKTASAARSVPIPDHLLPIIRDAIADRSPFELVIPDKNGKMLTKSAWRKMWQSYMTDLNAKYGQPLGMKRSKFDPRGIPMTIRPITPHCLRHTYATILHTAGVDVLTAQKLLGHSDVKTTLAIYTHLEEGLLVNDIQKLNTYLSGTPKDKQSTGSD